MANRRKPCGFVYTQTPCGKVKGIQKNGYHLYKGIRFATAERWEDPVVVTGWEGEYDATKFGDSCCQYGGFYSHVPAGFFQFYYDQTADKSVVQYSEDCLNLNIWAPENATNAPVAVFIHGGSFIAGGNSASNISNGEEYCKRGIILITINYRLNAFANGYDETHNGNQAIKDQIAALQWIKKNISAFGGNPDHLVAMGESAGALSVQCLLYSPYAKGMLSGAIMMSGGGNLDILGIPAPPEYTQRAWKAVMDKYSVKSLNELKDVADQEIFSAWSDVAYFDEEVTKHCAKPIVDGDVIPRPPAELMERGEVEDVPCMIGLSSEDMWPHILYTKALEWGSYHQRNNRSPVYAYYLDRQLPGGDNAGAYHGCDLWFAFSTLDRNWRPFEEIDYRISDDFTAYFSNFIINPKNPAKGHLPDWTPVTQDDPQFIHFGDERPSMCYPPVEKIKNAIQNTKKPFPGM